MVDPDPHLTPFYQYSLLNCHIIVSVQINMQPIWIRTHAWHCYYHHYRLIELYTEINEVLYIFYIVHPCGVMSVGFMCGHDLYSKWNGSYSV